jgi:hypothetical protein
MAEDFFSSADGTLLQLLQRRPRFDPLWISPRSGYQQGGFTRCDVYTTAESQRGCLPWGGGRGSCRFLSTPVREGVQDQLDAIWDSYFVIGTQEGFFDRVLLNVELLRDFAIANSFRDQVHDLLFARREDALTFAVYDACTGWGHEGFDEVTHLLRIRPVLSLVNDRDAAAKSPEGLASAAKEPANSGVHRIHDEIAIITVQQKNKTNSRMIRVHGMNRFYQMILIGGSVAEQTNIERRRT